MPQEENPHPKESPPPSNHSGKGSFLAELKRRKVYQVGLVYLGVGWLIIQVASSTFDDFGIPLWAYRFVVLMVALAFPIAMVLAWAFELTPEGVKLTKTAQAEAVQAANSPSHNRKRNLFAIAFAAGLPTLIFGTLALYFFLTRTEAAHVLDRSIAVLPFRSVSGEEENAYFCDGVHEDILTNLANFGALSVVSRTSVMRYHETEMSTPDIAEELDVAYVLEGSVQRAGNRVRVTAQLIDAAADAHIWAKNYDRDMTDIFEIQAELARSIADSLQAVITPEEIARLDTPGTKDPVAYDLLLRARAVGKILNISQDRRDELELALLTSALHVDPEYVDGWVALSRKHVHMYFGRTDPSEERLQKAREALDKAVSLDPDSAAVHLGFGNFYYYGFRDYARARTEYLRALRMMPNNVEVIAQLGYIARREGNWKEVHDRLQKAFALDPNNEALASDLMDVLHQHRHYKEALSIIEHMRRLMPQSDYWLTRESNEKACIARSTEPKTSLVEAYAETEIRDRFWLSFQRLWSFIETGDAEGFLHYWNGPMPQDGPFGDIREFAWFKHTEGLIYHMRGDENSLEKLLGNWERRLEAELAEDPDNQFRQFERAYIHALRGEADAAHRVMDAVMSFYEGVDVLNYTTFAQDRIRILPIIADPEETLDQLEVLLKEPSRMHTHNLRRQLHFYPLWDHPRFHAILDDPKNSAPLPFAGK
ncbi:MAG: tetratricopeptide repeat protein [Puniceicoccaceae bacterium]